MKLCLVSRRFDKDSGTAEWIYADWLRDNLIEKEFQVYTLEQKSAQIKSSALIKLAYDFFVLPIKIMYLRFIKNVRIFHFLSENQGIHAGWIRLTGAKSIFEFYDLMRIRKKGFSFDKLYFNLVYSNSALSNKVVAISSSTRDEIIRKIFIDQKKIVLVPSIYRDFNPLVSKNLIKKKRVIGYVGALGGRKRTELLIDLARLIKIKKIKDLKIEVWGGKGEVLDKHKKLSGDVKDIISFRGYAPESNLEEIYNSFDYFIFPSDYEGLGLPIIESAMCGIPCFILEDADIPEEVKKGCVKCKKIEEILEKILFLSKNPKKYASLKDRALIYSKNFKSSENLKKLINLYQSI